MLGSPERVDALNTHLWTYDPNGFLPHGAAKDGDADRQPVWLTHLDENPNGAAFLFVADHARSERVADYKRCFELFDGRDETAVAESRAALEGLQGGGPHRHLLAADAGRRLGEEGVVASDRRPPRSRSRMTISLKPRCATQCRFSRGCQ